MQSFGYAAHMAEPDRYDAPLYIALNERETIVITSADLAQYLSNLRDLAKSLGEDAELWAEPFPNLHGSGQPLRLQSALASLIAQIGVRLLVRETVDEALLRTTTDAKVWAREFLKAWDGQWIEPTGRSTNPQKIGRPDEGWMIGWFANAIETTRNLVIRETRLETTPSEQAALHAATCPYPSGPCSCATPSPWHPAGHAALDRDVTPGEHPVRRPHAPYGEFPGTRRDTSEDP